MPLAAPPPPAIASALVVRAALEPVAIAALSLPLSLCLAHLVAGVPRRDLRPRAAAASPNADVVSLTAQVRGPGDLSLAAAAAVLAIVAPLPACVHDSNAPLTTVAAALPPSTAPLAAGVHGLGDMFPAAAATLPATLACWVAGCPSAILL